ncbi:MAG: hypothetical protein HPY76_07680 [Anaerolineae bacterium]|nr:hypothetical protein [Anaerolineae bacterium]
MRYLIDGHNLIPKIRGFSLSDPDDESKLVAILNDFCRVRRHRVSVFYDGAPPGMGGTHTQGLVEVISVPRGNTADHAIMVRLKKMKGAARNVTVVSSDRQVKAAASASGATSMDSEKFYDLLLESLRGGDAALDERSSQLSPEDVREWMEIFRRGGDDDEKV